VVVEVVGVVKCSGVGQVVMVGVVVVYGMVVVMVVVEPVVSHDVNTLWIRALLHGCGGGEVASCLVRIRAIPRSYGGWRRRRRALLSESLSLSDWREDD
jgi:hypothetical protein